MTLTLDAWMAILCPGKDFHKNACVMPGCLFWVLCVVGYRYLSTSGWSLVQRSPTKYGVSECCVLSGTDTSLRQADHSSRGVLPSMVCLSVVCCRVQIPLYVGLITRPEESYQVRCVWLWSWNAIRGSYDPESDRKRHKGVIRVCKLYNKYGDCSSAPRK